MKEDVWRSFNDRSNKTNLDSFVWEALCTQKGDIVSGHSPCSDHHPFVVSYLCIVNCRGCSVKKGICERVQVESQDGERDS